jgi:hypothetical protein
MGDLEAYCFLESHSLLQPTHPEIPPVAGDQIFEEIGNAGQGLRGVPAI